jgi:ABC-2 type transport system permease protein
VRLLHAELLKIRTAPRTLLGLVFALLGLTILGSLSTADGADPETAAPDVLNVTSIAAIFTMILGILIVTWEYRHGTITQTFLATPRRERVVGAKYLLALAVGAILGLVSVAIALISAALWLGGLEITGDQWELAGRLVGAAGFWGVFGGGLGALMQSQIGAIITAFVWFLVAEPLLGFRLEDVSDYFPGSALDRLLQSESALEFPGEGYPYGLWTAAALVVAYASGFAALGIASAVRRDVP